KATAAILCQHGAPVYFQWTKGHNRNVRNEGADILAGLGAMHEIEEAVHVDTDIDHEFDVIGARLSEIT
ncbi:hypothetical protein ARMGADRAFT_945111, partial [Armillaria gallica]